MASISDIRDEIKNLTKELKSFDPKKDGANEEYTILAQKYDDLKEKIKTIDVSKVKDELDELEKTHSKVYISLRDQTEKTENAFDRFFSRLAEGVNHNTGNLKGLTTVAMELFGVFTNEGENIRFWRDYDRRIREVGVTYGISANRLEDYRKSNIELEREFISFGGTAEGLKEGIESLYESTNQTNQITQDFASTLGKIKIGMNVSEVEAGKIIAQFNNLNVSFETTAELLNDLRNAAEKSALNTNKVLKVFTDNFEKLNTFSFRNGVQGMTELVKQSVSLKMNMDTILKLSDDFTDPEKTMEFAANMQLLGGSFAQLGDFNQLMYDAAVAPEELAKNIAKSTASLGEFDRATGKFSLSYADRLQLKEAARLMGTTTEELNRMASTAAKVKDIKVALNFKDLTEEQYEVLGAMAQFDPSRGEYTVKMIDESGQEVTRSIAELSQEDIDKISATKETESLKSLVTQKFDAVDMTVMKLEIAKYAAPNLFEALAGNSEDLKNGLNLLADGIIEFGDKLKINIADPFEELTSDYISKNLPEVFNNTSEALGKVTKSAENLIQTAKTIEGEEVTDSIVDKVATETKTFFDNLYKEMKNLAPFSWFSSEEKSEGGILQGPSHEQGGIPFMVNGKMFELEGGETVLTKGVYNDPILRGISSELNQMGGGKKLAEDQGILEKTLKEKEKFISSTYNKEEKIFREGGILMNDISNVYNNLKSNKEGDILANSVQSFNTSSFINNMLKNNMINSLSNAGKVQSGGLIDRRGDLMEATVNVRGNVKVDGNVSFTPIKVSIDGLPKSNEIEVPKNIEKEIYRVVGEELNKMSLYTKFVTQKGTGINDGKSVNIQGITTNIS